MIIRLILTLVIVSLNFAGPFGLEKGQKMEQLTGVSLTDIGSGRYRAENVPAPHSLFEKYILTIGAKSGLCTILAVTKERETDVFGLSLQAEFSDLHKRLSSQYGTAKIVDELLPGSIWSEPRDYKMSVSKQERMLYAEWNKSSGAKLKDGIERITLEPMIIGNSDFVLRLFYLFDNNEKCDKEIKALEDDRL